MKTIYDSPATESQARCIIEMQEFSEYDLPDIDLKHATQKECAEYINKYWDLAHESAWAIEHGY